MNITSVTIEPTGDFRVTLSIGVHLVIDRAFQSRAVMHPDGTVEVQVECVLHNAYRREEKRRMLSLPEGLEIVLCAHRNGRVVCAKSPALRARKCASGVIA